MEIPEKQYVETLKRLNLGYQGENNARELVFDVSTWVEKYGLGEVKLLHRRPDEKTPYPAVTHREGNLVFWPLSPSDTAYSGSGEVQLLYFVGDVLVKSICCPTNIMPSLMEPGPAPDWQPQLLEQLTRQAARAEAAVQATATAENQAFSSAEKAQAAANHTAQDRQAAQNAAQDAVRQKSAVDAAAVQASENAQNARLAAEGAEADATQAAAAASQAKQAQQEAQKFAKNAFADADRAKAEANRSVALGLTSCKVGDTVRVQAVDNQGKPTAWEAVRSGLHWDTIMDAEAPKDIMAITFIGLPGYTHIRIFFLEVTAPPDAPSSFRTYINDKMVGYIPCSKKWSADVLDYNGWNYDEYNCAMAPSQNSYVTKSGLWDGQPSRNSPCYKLHLALDTHLTGGHIIIMGGNE